MSQDPRGPFFVTEWERAEYEREREMKRTVWHVVADLIDPGPRPYAVIRVDTSVRSGSGVEGTVVSLHSERFEAEGECHRLDREMLS